MAGIIAFDCSGKDIFVSYSDGEDLFNKVILKDSSGTECLMVAIDKCLKKSKVKLKEIDCIGICVGPGSWTGCRVAVSTLSGLVSGLSKTPKLFTFDTFDTFAYNEERAKEDKNLPVIFILPAYGQNVYVKQVSGFESGLKIESFMSKNEIKMMVDEDLIRCYALENVFDGVIVLGQDYKRVIETKVVDKEFVSLEEVEPLYIRPSQAEIQLTERLNRGK